MPDFKRSLAVVLGINEYCNGIPRLRTAVADTNALADLLEDDVTHVAFSPDSKTLASGSWNGNIILWDVSPQSWRNRAYYIANRSLSAVERQQYLSR